MTKEERETLLQILEQNFDEATKIGNYAPSDVASVMVTVAVDKYLDLVGYLPTIILFQELCSKMTQAAANSLLSEKDKKTP